MNIDVNAKGNRLISCSKDREIIFWDLNLKSEKSILSMFDEEHENVIEVAVFIPEETAKNIVKARMEQDNEDDKQFGETSNEENKGEEEKDMGEKEKSSETNALAKRGEELRKAREKLARLKGNLGTKTDKNNDATTEEDKGEEIVLTTEYIASGSRDKRIKIWNAKRGTCIMNLIGHDGWVNDIVFHPNGKYLLSASDDKSVRIWDMQRNGV